jgi:hypothetical protein
MITIFTIPRPFEGHFGIIQRNALKSWSLLSPDYEIILFGNEKGTAEIAAEFGFKHVPELERNEFGTPILGSVFNKTREIAKNDYIAALTGDIILMSDFKNSVDRVIKRMNGKEFLMIGGRYGLEIKEEMDFGPGWEEKFRQEIKQKGVFRGYSAIDYFVYPKNLVEKFPPFIIGAVGWDNWFISDARMRKIPVIDATPCVTIVHQDHIHPRADKKFFQEEIKNNYKLAGGVFNMMTLREADWILSEDGLEIPKMPRLLFSKLALFFPWRLLLFIKRKLNSFNAHKRDD